MLFHNIKLKREENYEKTLYQECHKRLYFTSLRILNSTMDAVEVMHDTLMIYLKKGLNFNTTSERDNWMARVCINLSIDRLRKYKSESHLFQSEELKNQGGVEEDYDDKISFKGVTVDHVKMALNNLPDGFRLILSLHLFEGYDYQEIAQITHLKEVSVRTQYVRGKSRLLEEIKRIKK